ncbi:MAG: 3-phosphoserine/phosphohydroxythreonine transaminase [Gammaproteobacteria bacterium]|nr:3-phosphoserine/phosphohydroxythreonine transaminase [Gammaproteobacteria bacterium]
MFNFASGPGMLPKEVLQQAQSEMLDWNGTGMSVMEMPFTSDEFQGIATQAHTNLGLLLDLPDNYHILFMQGGAYGHFSLLAMNLLGKNKQADYAQTGHWSSRAINEARRYGDINIVASSEESGFDHIPEQSEWRLNKEAAYCHITSNETANGVQFHWTPDTNDVPLIADVTSDFLTHKIDVSQYGMLYASAQKNIGVAGLTIVIIRDDLLDQSMVITPAVFNYGKQARNNSRVNTLPTYSIYISGLIFRWLLDLGGLDKVEVLNKRKADALYAVIDNDDQYHCPAHAVDRSGVNICFNLNDESMETIFLQEAANRGLINLKGHGVRGGIRASLYNAMPQSGVDALTNFMQDFSARNG